MRDIGSTFTYREVVKNKETFQYQTRVLEVLGDQTITELDITSNMVSSVTVPLPKPDSCYRRFLLSHRTRSQNITYHFIPPGKMRLFYEEVW